MNSFQDQNCNITLQEGLEIYYQSFNPNKPSIKDDTMSGNLFRDHDCTHVIFGLNTSIDQEALLDIWVLFGSDFRFKDMTAYMRTPQIKSLYDELYSKYGILGFLKISSHCFDCVGSQPFAIIAAHDTSVEHSRGYLEQNSCVAHVCM